MKKKFNLLNNQVDEWVLDKQFQRQYLHCLKTHLSEIKNALNYTYPDNNVPKKQWLCSSEIPVTSEVEVENERELRHCQNVSSHAKEILLVLYEALRSIEINNIASAKSEERLPDILRVCNNCYKNENRFGKNTNNSFQENFRFIVNNREKIISLAEEIVSLYDKSTLKR